MARDTGRPLREHLEELRWRLLIVVVALLMGAGVCVAFFRSIIAIMVLPAQGRLAGGAGGPIYTELTEILSVTVKVALLGGFVLALPVIVYQIMMFVAPGLTRRERRYAVTIFPGAILSFLGGAAFAYFLILPPILKFLLTFGGDVAVPMIRIASYINIVVTLLFWMGLIFETPLIMFVLSKLGVVTPQTMAGGRRYIVVVAFVAGALITPTFDPLNQALVAAPLIALYELGIWLAKLARWSPRRRRRRRRRAGT